MEKPEEPGLPDEYHCWDDSEGELILTDTKRSVQAETQVQEQVQEQLQEAAAQARAAEQRAEELAQRLRDLGIEP